MAPLEEVVETTDPRAEGGATPAPCTVVAPSNPHPSGLPVLGGSCPVRSAPEGSCPVCSALGGFRSALEGSCPV
ncbi:hypothetical protein QQF64_009397 [Cirrhinus molitorella]|uniref:Uncharacterized protein n=1 Tax=Cirrhinus molitorella TaxID=172907 RepID=A0ABR3M2K7_9TELE